MVDPVQAFLKEAVEAYLGQRSERVSHSVWPSSLYSCPKRHAHERYISKPELSIGTEVKIALGSALGRIVAEAIEWAKEGNSYTVTREVPITTGPANGNIDILMTYEDNTKWPIEVKWTGYSAPGFRIANIQQLAIYMRALKVNKGYLLNVYQPPYDGIGVFLVEYDSGAYRVRDQHGIYVAPPRYATWMPTNRYGEICILDEQLDVLLGEQEAWLALYREHAVEAATMPGPFAHQNPDHRCAKIAEPEYYKRSYNGFKAGDMKPGSGTIEVRCPLFATCYGGLFEGASTVETAGTYDYDGKVIGSKTKGASYGG